MADIESNIKVNIDTSDALSQLKLLQQQISVFQQAMKNAGQANAQAAAQMQQNLMTTINATGKFSASIQTIRTSAESFTQALEKNKLSTSEYFRYAGGASKTFGKLFKSEFDTIQQVAVDRVKTIQTQYIKLGRDASGAMKAIAVRPLALDMENLGTKTQIAAQKQQLFNQLMKQGSTQLLNFGKNTQWAGRQLMVGFTIPLTLMGQAAAKAYMEIEAASVKFRRVYGDMNTTTEEANKMVKSVQALANEFTKYGLAVSETMDMAASAAAMGKTGADLLAQVNQASKLAILGGVDQQQALETTISLTNTFGVSTKELAENVDFLNAVENQTVVSIEDLTIAIPKAAPVVRQLGGDVKDLAFFLTAMKEGGINASEGANALKSGMASLINPTEKASKFMKGFGINVKGIVEANKGDIKGTVVEFANALDTLDPLNRARAIEQMFGKFQFSRLSTLFSNVIDEGSQAATVAGLTRQTTEELAVLSEREMKKVADSPMFKFQKSIEDMQAKLAPVGEAFLKAVTPIIEFVSKILDGFNNLSEGTKSFVSMLVLAVAGIGPVLLMTFGLIANGVANIMKLFTNMKSFINRTTRPSDILGEQTAYMNSEQLKSAAIAASLDQSHSKLRQTFTSEAAALQQLTAAYRNAVQAQQAFSGVPGVPVGNPNAVPKKYANGVSMVPGPAGAGDIVPALLSPGEAVIPARSAKKYAPVIRGMIAGNLPGFEEGTAGVGMRQSMIGPMTEKQIEGVARTGKTLKEISDEVYAGPYGQTPVTNYGTQISPSAGHSFPAFGVAGVYEKPDGTKVFVKPQIDLVSAMAEIRGTTIARDVHGLVAPKQALRVMMDPTDPEDKRKFLVLESALDEKIANIPTEFTKDEYFKQLVASLLRGDKDLGVGNLGGNVLADVGPAGVFQRASGKRTLGSQINSMEEQAIINLLGVKGGAKRFFAEATADIAKSMTPAEYDAAMKAEIQAVAPKLQATIAGFGNLSPEEKKAYMDMQQRLQAGLGVDWGKYQMMHSKVPPKKLAEGGFIGIENSQSFAQSLMGMTSEDIKQQLTIQDTHLVEPIDITKNPQVLQQIRDVLPGVTKEELRGFEPVSNLTAQLPKNMNQKMKGAGYPPGMFASVWNGFIGKLSKSATIAGVDLPSSQVIEDKLGREIANSTENINDPQIGKIVERVLGSSAEIDDKKIYSLALKVAQLRSKPKQLGETDNELIHSIVLRMLKKGLARFNDNGTSIVRTIGQGNVTRFGTWEYGSGKGKVGSDATDATIEQKEIRRRAQDAAYGPTGWANAGNFNAPMPIVNRKLIKPQDWDTVTNPANWNRMTPEQKSKYLAAIPGTDPTTLSFRKQDYEQGFGNNKGPTSEWVYTASGLKPGIKWNPSQNNMQLAYNEMSKNGIIPAEGMKYFSALAAGKKVLKMAKGGMVPGYAEGTQSAAATGKPKASVFDVDDTLLDLASFMPAHQARNAKLPKEQRLNWWEEVAKDPKGIPAAIQRLRDAQMRGNKILLMTARPKNYDAVTMDTLQKLGIDTKGVKLISRENKDYRKPEQMKYEKTSKYMQWYDIEEFYDDMAKTRGAVSLLGINAINPLKLANGIFSVPGPKGAGDVVPAMLSPGEAVIPAKQAAQHRPMIQQMIAGNLPGYNDGGIVPGVPEPTPSGPEKSSGIFGKIANTIIDSSKKAGDVLVSKAKDAGERVAGQIVNAVLNPNNDRLTDSKGNVINEGVQEQEEYVQKKNQVIAAEQQAYVTAQLLGDQEHRQALEKVNQYNLMIDYGQQLTAEEMADFKRKKDLLEQKKKYYQDSFVSDQQAAGALAAAGTEGAKNRTFLQKMFTRTVETGKVQSGLYGVSAVAGVASTMGGGVGQAAQAALGPIGAAATAMSLIPGPAGLVVAGLAAIGTGAFMLKEHLDKVRAESLKLAKAMGSGNDAINKFATFAKSVSATETMNKRRELASTGLFNIVAGKKTFGESYMETEAGKQLVKDVSTSISQGGLDQAKQLITTQLSTAIASGVMTPAQARSIAANLGIQLKNASFGIDINGRLTELFGPNGENLKNDPLLVRLKVTEESKKEFEKVIDKDFIQKATDVAAGAATNKEAYSVFGLDLTFLSVAYWEKVNKAGATISASLSSVLETQQQMVDSLDIAYEKRIAELDATKDQVEINRLLKQQEEDRQKLLESNVTNTRDMYNKLQSLDGTSLSAVKTASENAIDTAFKDSGREVEASVAKETVKGLGPGSTDAQKILLNQMIASKQVDPSMFSAIEQLGSTEEGNKTMQDLLLKGGVTTQRALSISESLKGQQKMNLLVNIATADPAAAEETLSNIEHFRKLTGVFDSVEDKVVIDAMMSFAVDPKNVKDVDKIRENFEALGKKKEITLDVVENVNGKPVKDAIIAGGYEKQFNKLDNQGKARFTTQMETLLAMKGNPAMVASFESWAAETANKGKSIEEYFTFQADRIVTIGVDLEVDPNAQEDIAGEDQGPAASWLDKYVKGVKDAAKGNQALTTGIVASGNALKNFGKSSNELFGIFTQLKKAGASSSIIESALSGDIETTNSLINLTTGRLKAGAKQIFAGIDKEVAAQKKIDWLRLDTYEKLGKQNDMFNANLDVIKISEDKINKKYDERIKALDEINSLNERNANQQKAAFSIAAALSRGDIAGAAQAALEKRKQDAQMAIEDQKKFYESARQTELKSITEKVNGVLLTREQIEQRILTNTNRITRNKANELETLIRIGEQAEKIYGKSTSNPTVKKASGGLIMPQRFAFGGGVFGTDTVPAMLTPGEFVIRKSAVDAIGMSKLNAMNNGEVAADSVYNYNIQISVKSESNANDIANTVLKQIERLDSQRLRSVRI